MNALRDDCAARWRNPAPQLGAELEMVAAMAVVDADAIDFESECGHLIF